MNRSDWEFEYPAEVLAKAATEKRDHHNTRLAWWVAQQDAVMADVKSKGLEISESQSSLYSVAGALSGGQGAQVIVKNEYQMKLNECHVKIQQHAKLVKEYDGWVQVLDGNRASALKLKHSDWLFFFSKN